MPVVRVTLAVNSNQSLRTILLLQNLGDGAACHAAVLKTAQSKLRVKKPSQIYVAGSGKEMTATEDWLDLKDSTTLVISAGEAYVGAVKDETAQDGTASISQPSDISKIIIKNLANHAYVDPLSLTQLQTTAFTLPGIFQAAGQPDLHPGTKFPIGAVFVSKGWIHPPLIGGDIGCGMTWYKTNLSAYQVEGDKGRKVAEKLRGLEGAWRTQEYRMAWLSKFPSYRDPSPLNYSAGEEWDAALGTIGAGNHFAEIQVVENITSGSCQDSDDDQSTATLQENEVVLLVHSGSRGYGGDILRRHTANDTTSLQLDTPESNAYISEHNRALMWAERNRDLIALRFLSCLEPGVSTWSPGINNTDFPTTPSAAVPDDIVQSAYEAVQFRKVVSICHNSMEFVSWPVGGEQAIIHRKGAASVFARQDSSLQSLMTVPLLPLVPLPGSRGTPTLILRPIRTSTNDNGITNSFSIAHGAGRAMSRAKAATTVAERWKGRTEDLLRGDYTKIDNWGNKSTKTKNNDSPQDDMEEAEREGRKVVGGTWVVCEDKQLVWEEAPEAYKDVWDVGRDLVEAGTVERLGYCVAKVSYKVRKE